MSIIMHDFRKNNERFRRQQQYWKIYMYVVSGFVLAMLLYWLSP